MAENQAAPVRNIICAGVEDEEATTGHINPCTLEMPDSNNGKPFNYHLHYELHRLNTLRAHTEKRVAALMERNAEVADLSEEALKSKFVDAYGPVDFSDPVMKKRLKVMKDTLMEMETAEAEDDLYWDQVLDLEIDPEDPYVCKIRLDELASLKYGQNLQHKYGNVVPETSAGDWFVLPRPTRPEMGELSLKMRSLHLYDPKVELCFKQPYVLFNQFGDDKEVPRKISVRVVELVNKFPLGIGPGVFWEEFLKTHGYTPNIPDAPDLLELLSRLKEEISFIKTPDGKLVMFPTFVKGIIEPGSIMKMFWHAIKCLLSHDPVIETHEVTALVENHYGFKFKPRLWGYRDMKEFLSMLLQQFSYQSDIIVFHITYSEGFVEKKRELLVINHEEIIKKLKNLHGVNAKVTTRSNDMLPSLDLSVPAVFMTRSSVMRFASNSIWPDRIMYAELRVVHDPENLGIILECHAARVHQFQDSMQKPQYKSSFEGAAVSPECVRVGMCVMVSLSWGCWEGQWYRVKILLKDDHKDRYLVYGLDFGFLEYVSLESLRYMPLSIGSIAAYSVPCCLHGVRPPKGRINWNNVVWPAVTDKFFKDGQHLRVHFVKKNYSEALGCFKWSVKIDTVELPAEDAKGGNSPIKRKLTEPTTVAFGIHRQFPELYLTELNEHQRKVAERKEKSSSSTTEPNKSTTDGSN